MKGRELGKERLEAREILVTDSIDGVIKYIKDGSAVGVSDGLLQHKFSTAY